MGVKGKITPGGKQGGRKDRVTEYLVSKQKKLEDMRRAMQPSFTPDISASSKRLVRRMMMTQRKPDHCDWKGLLLTVDTAETQDSAPDTPRLRSPAVD